ncbi:hypothetical protein F2Q69_00038307 [Brassica cretica]|uniref:Uncharacterized protein n=1 Tax=Brassica cretica TaxID=69181 RepID=A0A8S9SL78_BRACR|nr:hypothetical protein F2Q69_00038307 [Brassica cretica]
MEQEPRRGGPKVRRPIKRSLKRHRRSLFKPLTGPTRAGHRAQTPTHMRVEAHELAVVVEKPTSTHHAKEENTNVREPNERHPPEPNDPLTRNNTPPKTGKDTEALLLTDRGSRSRPAREKIDLHQTPKSDYNHHLLLDLLAIVPEIADGPPESNPSAAEHFPESNPNP